MDRSISLVAVRSASLRTPANSSLLHLDAGEREAIALAASIRTTKQSPLDGRTRRDDRCPLTGNSSDRYARGVRSSRGPRMDRFAESLQPLAPNDVPISAPADGNNVGAGRPSKKEDRGTLIWLQRHFEPSPVSTRPGTTLVSPYRIASLHSYLIPSSLLCFLALPCRLQRHIVHSKYPIDHARTHT